MEAPSIPWGDLGRVAATIAGISLIGGIIAATGGCSAPTQSAAEEAAQAAQEAVRQVAEVPQEKAPLPAVPEIKPPAKTVKPPAKPATQPKVQTEAEKAEEARLEKVKGDIAKNFELAKKALDRVTEALKADNLKEADGEIKTAEALRYRLIEYSRLNKPVIPKELSELGDRISEAKAKRQANGRP